MLAGENIVRTVMVCFFVAMLVFILTKVYFEKTKKPKPSDRKGRGNSVENAVKPLQTLAKRNKFRFIGPAEFEYSGRRLRVDGLMIGYFGVLGVIGLGYNGGVYGDASEDEWIQVMPDGQRVKFPSPMLETAADVRAIRSALFADKLKKVPVEVHAVFTNYEVKLGVPRSTGVLSVGDWRELLKEDRFLDDTGLDLDEVEAAIRAGMVNDGTAEAEEAKA